MITKRYGDMEILKVTISILLLLGLILSPIFIFIRIRKLNHKWYHFLLYLLFAVLIGGIILWISAWWNYYSAELLMSHYGYDFNAFDIVDSYKSVELNDLERVKSLRKDRMGVGWPLKAILGFVFYIPYLLTVYIIGWLMGRKKIKSSEKELDRKFV